MISSQSLGSAISTKAVAADRRKPASRLKPRSLLRLSDVQQLRQEAASTYVLEEDLPDFTTYATKTEVTTAIDNALANLTNLEELNY